MVPQSLAWGGGLSWEDPPRTVSGVITITLEPSGLLVWLEAIPPQWDPSPEVGSKPDWMAPLAEAGLTTGRLKEVAPIEYPLLTCDAKAAWEGPAESFPGLTVRYEAGAYRGKPVYFSNTIPPWQKPARMEVEQRGSRFRSLDSVRSPRRDRDALCIEDHELARAVTGDLSAGTPGMASSRSASSPQWRSTDSPRRSPTDRSWVACSSRTNTLFPWVGYLPAVSRPGPECPPGSEGLVRVISGVDHRVTTSSDTT